jgi:hypothetical protein
LKKRVKNVERNFSLLCKQLRSMLIFFLIITSTFYCTQRVEKYTGKIVNIVVRILIHSSLCVWNFMLLAGKLRVRLKKKKKLSRYRPGQALGVQGV